MRQFENPPLNVVLVEPQIPPNTGNIARLCAATRCHLILAGELGFELSDRTLRRAGLDYWEWVSWEHIPDWEEWFRQLALRDCHFLSTHATTHYNQMNAQQGDYIFFGKETAGLPKWTWQNHPERSFTIPMWEPKVRSLNLASAASIVVYDALRHILEF
jgi:tRNA (cytidine/uridine-2'-O-)-methyltransferase